MKRKIISLLLALCLIVGMIPLTASAGSGDIAQVEGGDTYATLEAAINAVPNGGTVTLLNDFVLYNTIRIQKKTFTLDMNGKTMNLGATTTDGGTLIFSTDSNVTINGNGSVGMDQSYFADDCASSGRMFETESNAVLTIENGTYYGGLNCILTDNDSQVYINGGHYSVMVGYDGRMWVLNRQDKTNSRFFVKGGSFTDYNPYNSETENPIENFCAEGYVTSSEVVDEHTLYTVIPAVAKVESMGKYYSSLKDAIESANVGDTITLLCDYMVPDSDENEYNLPDNCILDLGEKTLTVPFMKAIFQGKNATIQNGTVTSTADYPLFLGNSSKETNLTVKNVKVEGGINVYAAKVTLIDVIAEVGEKNYHAVWGDEGSDITIQSGTFSANPSKASSWAVCVFGGKDAGGTEDGLDDHGNITILGGNIKGKVGVVNWEKEAGQCMSISGGYFTSDPSDYVAEGYYAGESDQAGYTYQVVAGIAEHPAEVVATDPDVKIDDGSVEDKENVSAALSGVKADLVPAANTQAENNTVTETAAKNALVEANVIQDSYDKSVTVVIQPYLKITAQRYQKTNDETAEMVLDITPMYRTVATTADLDNSSDKIIIKDEADDEPGESVNAVIMEKDLKLNVTRPIDISIPLPNGFANSDVTTLYIKHVKGNGATYFYTGSVSNENTGDGSSSATQILTFSNPNGFSEFTISSTNGAVAKVNNIGYATFQEALNAVEDGGTIEILQSGTYTISGNKSFKVKENGVQYTLNAKAGYTLTMSEDGTYFVKPSIPGGHTPSEPGESNLPFTDVKESAWYYDAVKYVHEHHIMIGTSGTTFEPNTLLTRAQAVQILYNLEGQPTVTGNTTFTDVSGHWALDPISWAQKTGIVKGYEDNSFRPNRVVTREEFAEILYNYASYKGYDLTTQGDLSKFPDSGKIQDWAEAAMEWTNGSKLINGHDDGTVDPQGNTTRAQTASILMRFDLNLVQ